MADFVLQRVAHFSKSLRVAVGDKDGIIAEARRTTARLDDLAVDDAFEEMFLAVQDEGKDRAETGTAVLYPFQVLEQLAHIGLRIVCIARITCRIDSRRTVQGFYLQAGIVGKAILVIRFVDEPCLEQGVPLQRVRRLGDVGLTADVLQAEDFYLFADDGFHFLQLVGIVSGKYKLLHNFLLLFSFPLNVSARYFA